MSNLILTICSNTKQTKGEVANYDTEARKITGDIYGRLIKQINNARNWAFDRITRPGYKGRYERKTPSNQALKRGPDISGDAAERGGLYLPALKRYMGRFYKEFRKAVGNIDDHIQRMEDASDYHMLIVSGLYGLLTPTEPIQNYDCHVTEDQAVRKRWAQNDLLTELVVAYINKHGITRVFDCMAEDSYRRLIDWELLERRTGIEVLHAHSRKGERVGIDLLPELGKAVGLLLSGKLNFPDDDLNHQVAEIEFRPEKPKWMSAGAVPSVREDFMLWTIRMENNISRFLADAGFPKVRREGDVSIRIKKLKKQNRKVSCAMTEVVKYRNKLTHNELHELSSDAIETIKTNYKIIARWAKERGYNELYEVGYQ